MSNTTPRFDHGPEVTLPMGGDGSPDTSHGEATVSMADYTGRDGQRILRVTLPDRFGVPGAMIDLAEDDALALAMTLTSFLKCEDLDEARRFADFVTAGQALAEEGFMA